MYCVVCFTEIFVSSWDYLSSPSWDSLPWWKSACPATEEKPWLLWPSPFSPSLCALQHTAPAFLPPSTEPHFYLLPSKKPNKPNKTLFVLQQDSFWKDMFSPLFLQILLSQAYLQQHFFTIVSGLIFLKVQIFGFWLKWLIWYYSRCSLCTTFVVV